MTVFHGRSCPSLFLSTFLSFFATQRNLTYQSIAVDLGAGINALERYSCMSLFGGTSFVWCGDFSTLGLSIKKAVGVFGSSYNGPHQLAIFCGEKDRTVFSEGMSLHISCDMVVDREFFLELAHRHAVVVSGRVWDVWKKRRGDLGLDDACRLIRYTAVLGDASVEEWLNMWEERLFPGEQSLFKLSQYFFARDRVLFMKLWEKISRDYPPEFWIVYWSEQLWQAHMVVASMQNKVKPPMTNRLPFSFLQRDWRKCELRELVVAHTALYNTDFSLKNGIAASYAIELFVFKFINDGFVRL